MRQAVFGFMAILACLLHSGAATAFDFKDVVDKAAKLSESAYSSPPTIPRFMRELTPEAYRGIRFNPERSLWRETDSRFQARLLSAGHFYANPVRVNIVDSTGVQRIPYRKTDFEFADAELQKRVPADLGHAGFELTYPMAPSKQHSVFVSFAGASTFQATGRNNIAGASARGVTVNTGLLSGEEFPAFVEFWLERPAPSAHAMKFYALLDGKSLTGAYQFTVFPGDSTRVQVEAVLFPRNPIELLGAAPLTSMFLYGENTARPAGAWRPEVHNSDGLLVHNDTGEWLYRPLINPLALQIDHFMVGNVKGFGLLQRDTNFASYQDIGTRFEHRPSVWIEPRDQWGPGRIVLVQLPTPDQSNDNVVAFWSSERKLARGDSLRLGYTMHVGGTDSSRNPMGRAVNTFVGDGGLPEAGNTPGSVRLHVDFTGGPLEKLKPRAPVLSTVTADKGGEIIEHFVEYNESLKGWRMSILAKPAAEEPLMLRGFLHEGENTLSETWTYVLPVKNNIIRNER